MAKPQLHVSMLDMAARCGIQLQRRYGARFGIGDKEEIIPPSIALITGIVNHTTAEKNLSNKMETGSLLSLENIKDMARDEFEGLWQGGLMLTDTESVNIKKTHAEAIDKTIALAGLHHTEFAPEVNPVALEEKFVIELEGYPINLAGQKDIVEENAIGDIKTKAQQPGENAAMTMQMGMYAMDFKLKKGEYPAKVFHQYLVKTKTPKAVYREAVPNDEWIKRMLHRVTRFIEVIDAVKSGKQAFMPADPESWICSKTYCGYATTCPFWSGK
jgi:hypothetical protein